MFFKFILVLLVLNAFFAVANLVYGNYVLAAFNAFVVGLLLAYIRAERG